MDPKRVSVVGAGLAGVEATWQLAKVNVRVDLFEMRPHKSTAAHLTSGFAELVCSNSFGSDAINSASRILKDELEILNSYVLRNARQHSVPAGASLAVDRVGFSKAITHDLGSLNNVSIHRQEVVEIPEGIVVIATGPLTSCAFAERLSTLLTKDSLYFYDAISPIISTDSLNLDPMFYGSRYEKGDADFLNIPLTQEQYRIFVNDILNAQWVDLHPFEEEKYFESCLPIEVLAARGLNTLAFGPLKPVGLRDPRTGKLAHAIVQLRTENKYRTAYNMVGFQTKMKYGEQVRIFRKLPGLEGAEFLRLGSIHRNTFVHSPSSLLPTLQLKRNPRVFLAGQLTGTEGYLESAATGLVAGLNAANLIFGRDPLVLPTTSMLGALLATITDPARKHFQPMNVNMGLLPPLGSTRIRSREQRNEMFATRAIRDISEFILKVRPENYKALLPPSNEFLY